MNRFFLTLAALVWCVESLRAARDEAWLHAYNVVWTNQSADARGSMPIGEGNIGLNVWVEKFRWPNMRYPVFYDTHGFCQRPDFDHGGGVMVGMQDVLLQAVDNQILLFPAWPKDWDCEFKLHAPHNTTVAGRLQGRQTGQTNRHPGIAGERCGQLARKMNPSPSVPLCHRRCSAPTN